MTSIGQVADWIIKNRRDKAFYGYTYDGIVAQLEHCAKNLSMLCVTENGEIVGVVCCDKDTDKKVMFVHDILTTKLGVTKRMAEFFRQNYPQYTYTGLNRHGRKRRFSSIEKVAQRL